MLCPQSHRGPARLAVVAGGPLLQRLHLGVAGVDAYVVHGVVGALCVAAEVVDAHEKLAVVLHAGALLQGHSGVDLVPLASLRGVNRIEVARGKRVYELAARYVSVCVGLHPVELEYYLWLRDLVCHVCHCRAQHYGAAHAQVALKLNRGYGARLVGGVNI